MLNNITIEFKNKEKEAYSNAGIYMDTIVTHSNCSITTKTHKLIDIDLRQVKRLIIEPIHLERPKVPSYLDWNMSHQKITS